MSNKSLLQKFKTIIKKKLENINNEGAEILIKLDEIKCEVDSFMCKANKTALEVQGETSKKKFSACIAELEEIITKLVIIKSNLENKDSEESDEECEGKDVAVLEGQNTDTKEKEIHQESDRSAEKDLSGKDTTIKANREDNSRNTQGSPDVDIEVNEDSSDTRAEPRNTCVADTVNEQLGTHSTCLETEPTHFDRPDATRRERAASPALTGRTRRSSNSDASYASAQQSPTGSRTSSRGRRLRKNEPYNSGSNQQFIETPRNFPQINPSVNNQNAFVSPPAASYPPNVAQVPTFPPRQYYQQYGATAVPSASTQYRAFTLPHTYGYGVSGVVPNSPHPATSPPNLFTDTPHPQTEYYPSTGQYTTSAMQSQIPVATSNICDMMSSLKFPRNPTCHSTPRAKSTEPSIVPKCEKSEFTQQHRKVSSASDPAAGNMQQNERLVSKSTEDRSVLTGEHRQQQTDKNRRFQRESTPGTTSNTYSSGKVNDGESSRASTGAPQSTAKKRHRKHKAKREVSPEITIPSQYGLGPELGTMDLTDGIELKVFAVSMENPTHLWIQADLKKFYNLKEKMKNYYSQLKPKTLKIPVPIKPGMMVCATYKNDGEYYRARVVGVEEKVNGEPRTVRVLYVDYGNDDHLEESELQALPEAFCQLEACAIPCALSQVAPKNGGLKWQPDVRDTLRNLLEVENTQAVTHAVIHSEPECPLAFVDLFASDGNGNNEVAINVSDELIRLNLARRVRNKELAQNYSKVARHQVNEQNMLARTTWISMQSVVSPPLSASELSFNDSPSESLPVVEPTQSLNDRVSDWIEHSEHNPTSDVLDEGGYHRPSVKRDVAKRMVHHHLGVTGNRDQQQLTERTNACVRPKEAHRQAEGLSQVLQHDINRARTSQKQINLMGDEFLQGHGVSLRLDQPDTELRVNEGQFDFMVSHIDDPSEFYIHPISLESSQSISKMTIEINAYFNRYSDHELCQLSESVQLEPGIYVTAMFADGSLYRGLVLALRYNDDWKGDEQRIRIHYIDYGNKAWVSRHNVFPLPAQFALEPPQAVYCTLAGVQPLRTEDDSDVDAELKWSQSAKEQFEEISGLHEGDNRQLIGIVSGREGFSGVLQSSFKSPLSLIVIDTSDEQIPEGVYINEELIRFGSARPTNVISAERNREEVYPMRSSTHDQEPGVAEWDPMEQDYHDIRNSTAVDIDDPQVAVMRYKARDETRICKYFAAGRECWSGEYCRFEHAKRDNTLVTTDCEETFTVDSNFKSLETPKKGEFIVVEVTAVYNPAHFYVTFPYGTNTINELHREETSADEGYAGSTYCSETFDELRFRMNEHYKQKAFSDRDLTHLGFGEIVAVRFPADGNWYRARVVSDGTGNLDNYEVFYLDFGNKECTSVSHIRRMQPEFMHLPFQCVECHLPITSMQPEWSQEARDHFRILTDGKILFARIVKKSVNGLTLDLYNTDDGEICINEDLIDKGYAREDMNTVRSRSGSTISSPSDVHSKDMLYYPG